MKKPKADLTERDFIAWCANQDVAIYRNNAGEPLFYDNKTDETIFPARTGKDYAVNFSMTQKLIKDARASALAPKPVRLPRNVQAENTLPKPGEQDAA